LKEFPQRVAAICAEQPLATPTEIWFQDEMRIGQKTQRTRVGARRGSRPRQVADLRTGCAYLFGAICPQRQTGAAIVMPRADTQGMKHHLDEISANVIPGAHAVLVLDQAGWHTTKKLRRPDYITFLPLPPRSPEVGAAVAGWRDVAEQVGARPAEINRMALRSSTRLGAIPNRLSD
jgi:hypothetical protein